MGRPPDYQIFVNSQPRANASTVKLAQITELSLVFLSSDVPACFELTCFSRSAFSRPDITTGPTVQFHATVAENNSASSSLPLQETFTSSPITSSFRQ